MSKSSTRNYDNAQKRYDELVQKYYGSENYKELYKDSAEVAAVTSKKVQEEKYKQYLGQGLNPAKAARMASADASENYQTTKDNLTDKLYSTNQDAVNAAYNNIGNAKAKDDINNANNGRKWSILGGITSGIANAI